MVVAPLPAIKRLAACPDAAVKATPPPPDMLTASELPDDGALIVQLPALLIVPLMFAASNPPVWKISDLAPAVPTVNTPS